MSETNAQAHLQEMEAKLYTSKYAVTKAVGLLDFMSDEDRKFVISQAHEKLGLPQQIRVPAKRNRKGTQDPA